MQIYKREKIKGIDTKIRWSGINFVLYTKQDQEGLA